MHKCALCVFTENIQNKCRWVFDVLWIISKVVKAIDSNLYNIEIECQMTFIRLRNSYRNSFFFLYFVCFWFNKIPIAFASYVMCRRERCFISFYCGVTNMIVTYTYICASAQYTYNMFINWIDEEQIHWIYWFCLSRYGQ